MSRGGLAEMFTSRRTTFEKCFFWSQERCRDNVKREEISRKIKPTGYFMAKDSSDENSTHQTVGGAFIFERNTITLKTYDDISNLEHDDFVKYDGRMWIVDDIRRKKNRRQSQFGTATPYVYYISLRK